MNVQQCYVVTISYNDLLTNIEFVSMHSRYSVFYLHFSSGGN